MELFQDFFVKALLALVFAGVLTKLVSVVFLNDGNKVVGKQVKPLRVKGTRSKRRVKFADDVVVKHVDYHHYQFEAEEVELMERVIVEEKGEIFTRVDQVGDDDQGVNDDDAVCGKVSESTRNLVESMEGGNFEEKIENGTNITRFDRVDDEEMNEDGKVILHSDEVVGICSDDSEKVSKKTGLLNQEVVEGKSEDIMTDEVVGVRFDDSEKVSKKTGLLNQEVVEGKSEDIMTDEVVGVCSDDSEKVFKKTGLLNQEVVEGKSEDIMTDESSYVKEENVGISGVDNSILEEIMKHLEGMMENEDASLESGVVTESDGVVIGVKEGDEVARLGENPGGLSRGDEEEEGKVIKEGVFFVDNDDDEWEEIERTQLEKRFGKAVNYVECGGKRKDNDQLPNLGSDVQMQLYGLHKIAVEGPCHEPQPMALNFSARAKWNAWQKHGSMSPEVAMEEYIELLTENVPSWIEEYSAEDGKQGNSESRMLDDPGSQSSFQHIRPDVSSERELEFNCGTKEDHPTAGTNSGSD